uniref:NADH dehydrogenase subunit 4L n=1 Tax=Labidocera rotunda TaxID=207950 RepID=UPI0020374553|nr:NADH dehydrogenase subunit 4L [Labidocera rotunda]URC16607.1 NADH dehydrogenase subunit 4L [Labidocera rotunda]
MINISIPFLIISLIMGLNFFNVFFVVLAFEVLIYLLSLMKSWYHVILLMLILEFFSIKGFVICSMLLISKISSLFLFFFSVMMVCEASMGMGLIVSLTRGWGDEAIEI